MKLKIGQISKMTGFSPSGIRFYENAGIIHPERGENGKYRYYGLQDLNLLLACKNYRMCGFSLQETVELLHNIKDDSLKYALSNRHKAILKEIQERELLVDYLVRTAESIESYRDSIGNYQFKRSPALLRFKLSQPGSSDYDHIPNDQVSEWIDFAPFVDSCFLFNPQEILSSEGELCANTGIAIEEKYANLLGFCPETSVEYIPSKNCIYTLIEITPELTLRCDQLYQLRAFLNTHSLQITGPVIARRLFDQQRKEKYIRYDHLWVPVIERYKI